MSTLTADRNRAADRDRVTAQTMVVDRDGPMVGARETQGAAAQGTGTGAREIACHWCSAPEEVGTGEADAGSAHRVADEGACRLIVPRRHVANLTELPMHEMAAVLAALSAESSAMRSGRGECQVEIDARADATGHLVIRLTPCTDAPVAHDRGPGPFASLVRTLAD